MTIAFGFAPSPRLYGLLSLALVAAYAVAVGLAAQAGGPGFDELAAFPLGGVAGDGGRVLRALALTLSLSLGWAVPGVSLALLTDQRLRGGALLARSLGLGIGYLFVAGLGYAMVAGHAPPRAAFLVELALPGVLLTMRPTSSRDERGQFHVPVVTAFVVMALLLATLWPKLRYEGMNGDGTEAYELSRSLESHPLPRWELEGAAPPGRFGTPITVPFFTGAYFVFGQMAILGKGELAIRIPFIISLTLLVGIAVNLSASRGRFAWLYACVVAAIYVLWNAYYVGYEAPLDLAEPAGTDTLTTALFLAGLAEVMAGSPAFGVGFMLIACGMTYSGPLLTVLALSFLWWIDRDRATRATPLAIAGGGIALAGIGLAGWQSGEWPEWVRAFTSEYWQDLVAPSRRMAATPLFARLLLMTCGLPLAIIVAWKILSRTGRLLTLTGAAYLVIVLAGSYKNLHYLMPLPWLFLGPALESTGVALRLVAIAMSVAVGVMSWPNDVTIRRETALLGAESCVQGLDYEAALLAAAPIYSAFDTPAWGERFGVSKHTFVRYGLELGGRDCVVGLSRTVPAGAVALVDGLATVWTIDPTRYARWRFAQVPLPSSTLFPRESRVSRSADAATWPDRLVLSEVPARWLLLDGFSRQSAHTTFTSRARMLVPLTDVEPRRVRLFVVAPRPVRVRALINGRPASDLAVDAGAHDVVVEGPWQDGWNVLDVDGADGVTLERVETRK
ncbi:MAG: hypothetical protein ACRD2N_02810 [Vicinamibacterales bacterium]